MHKDYELAAVDRAITERLSSRAMLDAITSAIKVSVSETAQRASVNMAEIAEEVVGVFKNDLRDAIVQASNDWVSTNGVIQVVPSNTKLFKRLGDYQICVVEQPPTIRTLNFDNQKLAGGGRGSYSLALPYVVFIFWIKGGIFHAAFIAYGVKPLDNINNEIFAPNLPNIHGGLNICMGNSFTNQVAADAKAGKIRPLTVIIDEAIAHFWGSVFNNDLGTYYQHSATHVEEISSLDKWQENTLKDPLFMLRVKWDQKYILSRFLNPADGEGIFVKIGPIVDKAIKQACDKLAARLSIISNNVATNKSVAAFKHDLYGHLSEICLHLLDTVGVQNKEEIRRDLAAKGPGLEERVKTGDYLYSPPNYGVW